MTLTAAEGFRILGADVSDRSARFVSSAGDVNGDGFDDLLVGAYRADAAGNAKNQAGESYVIFGSDFIGGIVFAGTAGNDVFIGTAAAETFVGGLGDDTLSGGGGADAFQGGAGNNSIDMSLIPLALDGGSGIDTMYLEGLGSSTDLSGPDSGRIVNIEKIDLGDGQTNTLVLSKLAVLGMAGSNGDAFDDNTLLIRGNTDDLVSLLDGWTRGATVSNPLGETGNYISYTNGAARLLIESEVGVYTGAIDLAALTDTQGFRIFGADVEDFSGFSVSSAGDVDGDGFEDLIVCSYRADSADNERPDAGESYVIFGRPSGFSDIDLAALTPAQGFRILGADAYDEAGFSVSSAGDVNGDGLADLLIGAKRANDRAGETYVIFGKSTGLADIDLAALTPVDGFRIGGVESFDFSGSSVSSAGDVNGDGFDDLIIGAPYTESFGNARTDAGESYVIFGKGSGLADISLGALTPTDGFRIFGADLGDRSGDAVSSAGDVNGDGFDDIIVAAPFADASGNAKINAGESYVIFGKASGFADIDLAAFTPADGFVIWGNDPDPGLFYSDQSVSSAGDVNGDGFDDLAIGARFADGAGETSSGQTYVIFGKASGFTNIDLAALAPTDGFTIYGQDFGRLLRRFCIVSRRCERR